MLRKAIKQVFLEFNKHWSSEAFSLELPLFFELQLASIMISERQHGALDSPILRLIKLTNFSNLWVISSSSHEILIPLLLALYLLLFGSQAYLIVNSILKRESAINFIKPLLAKATAIQRIILIIPVLFLAKNAIVETTELYMTILSWVLFVFVAWYNLLLAFLKIDKPFKEKRRTQFQEYFDIIFIIVAVWVNNSNSSSLLSDRNSLPLGGLICLLILTCVRILLTLLNPHFSSKNSERAAFLSHIIPLYTILNGFSTFWFPESLYNFPWLIVAAVWAKTFLSIRTFCFKKLISILCKEDFAKSSTLSDWALRNLFHLYDRSKNSGQLEKELFFDIMVPLLHSKNHLKLDTDILTSQAEEEVDICSSQLSQLIHPALFRYINLSYDKIITASKLADSIPARIAHIYFLATQTDNHIKAFLDILEVRRVLSKNLWIGQEICLQLIQEEVETAIRASTNTFNNFDLEYYFEAIDAYQRLRSKVFQIIRCKSELLETIIQPVCNLDSVKRLGVLISKQILETKGEFDRIFEKGNTDANITGLSNYFDQNILETDFRYVKMLQFSNCFRDNIDEVGDSETALVELQRNSKLSIIAFSLNQHDFGDLIAYSPDFASTLELNNKRNLKNLSLEDLFPALYASHYKTLMREMVTKGTINLSKGWSTTFMNSSEGVLIEFKAKFKVEIIKGTMVLVLYLMKETKSTNFILCDNESQEVIGTSKGLFDSSLKKIEDQVSFTDIHCLLNKKSQLKIEDIIDGFNSDPDQHAPNMQTGILKLNKLIKTQSNDSQGSLTSKKHSLVVTYSIESYNVGSNERYCLKINFHKLVQLDELRRGKRYGGASLYKEKQHSISDLSTFEPRKKSAFNYECPTEAYQNPNSPTLLTTPLEPTRPSLSQGVLSKKISKDSLFEVAEVDKLQTSNNQEKEDQSDWDIAQLSPEKLGDGSDFSLDYGKKSATAEIEDRSLSAKSSIASHKRKSMKQMLQQMNQPKSLVFFNIFGHLVVIGLVTIIIVSYLILDNNYLKFSRFAVVAPFPSYFASVTKSIYAVTEQVVSANKDLYPAATAPTYPRSAASVYKDRIQRFMAKYNAFMVDYDVEGLSSSFHYEDFDVNITREGIWDAPTTITIQEASLIMLGVIYKLNKTASTKITPASAEVEWIRSHASDMIMTYEAMRQTLYKDFYGQQKNILTLYDGILYFAIGISCLAVMLFLMIFRKLDEDEIHLLRQLTTIPKNTITVYIDRLRKELIQQEIEDKGKFKERSHLKKMKIEKKSHDKKINRLVRGYYKKPRNMLVAMLGCVLILGYISGFYAVSNVYYKSRATDLVPLIDSVNFFSEIVPIIGWSAAILTHLTNLYDQPELSAPLNETIQTLWPYYKKLGDKVVDKFQNLNAGLLQNRYINDKVKERYQNITSIKACEEIIANVNYPTCLTGFNGAANLGFSAMFTKAFDFITTQNQILSHDLTLTTIKKINAEPNQKSVSAFGVTIDANVVGSIELEGQNLSNAMASLRSSLIVFLVVGILMMLSILFVVWRPLNKKMQREFLDTKTVFTAIPVSLINDNSSIKTAIKRYQETVWGRCI